MAKAVDAHEVFDLAGVLAVAGDVAADDALAIVRKGATNVKRDWRLASQGIAHAPRYPRSIGFDIVRRALSTEAVIGPEDSPVNQGFLGPILEFGGAHNAPRDDGGQAMALEEPRFVQAMTQAGSSAI